MGNSLKSKVAMLAIPALLVIVFQNCGVFAPSESVTNLDSNNSQENLPEDDPSTLDPSMGNNPPTPEWSAISTVGAPLAANCPQAVWANGKMIVVGGATNLQPPTADATPVFAYDPVTDTWETLPSINAHAARKHSLVVTNGTDIFDIAGMFAFNGYYVTAYKYNIASGAWSEITGLVGNPRFGHAGVWTGNSIFAFSGSASGANQVDPFLPDSFEYDVTNNTWTEGMMADAGRNYAAALNVGNSALLWGGSNNYDWANAASTGFDDFLIYDYATKTFSNQMTVSPLARRSQMASAWTGSKAIYWGGNLGPNNYFGDGALYDPAGNSWEMLPALNAPSARRCAASVWTGSEFIVWGGLDANGNQLLNGARLTNLQ